MSRPIRVLLVEDSASDAALLLLELRRAGYAPVYERVETAAAMQAALDRQPWEVVIADYVLPKFSGPAALKLLQAHGLDLPFIIVSGHIDEDTAVASMKAGAHDYVMKDRLTRLVPAIERELQEAASRRARRQADEQFAREQTFRHAIESSIPSGIVATDSAGRLTYVNPAFCELVGWSEAELLSVQPPYPFSDPEDSKILTGAAAKITKGRLPRNGLELRFLHRSGRRFDVLVQLQAHDENQGQAAGWLASVTDITERKQAEQRLHVQYQIARILTRAPSLKAATSRILAAIGESMGWAVGSLWRLQPGDQELQCVDTWHGTNPGTRQFEAACRQTICTRGSGLAERILAQGEPLWVQDTQNLNCPRAQLAVAASLHSACGFPLRLGQETLGVIEFFGSEIREPEATLLNWMATIGNQIGQFMEREMAEEALRRAHNELELRVRERTADLMTTNVALEKSIQERKRLENELLEITEKERRRIGLDLHDDLGQKMTGITLMMKGLELGLQKRRVPEAEEARKIGALIEQTVTHASNLAHNLVLTDLPEDDLPSALTSLAANVNSLFEISCRFKSEGAIPLLDKQVVMQFYKITQEAVTNAVKHGKARQVGINLTQESDRLILTVRNNGLPFPSMIDQRKGMGLRIMNYRASTIGASLEITPARPKGTLVTCSLSTKPKPTRATNGTSARRV